MIRKKQNKKMTIVSLMKRTAHVRIRKVAGKKFAVLPFGTWKDIEGYLEDEAGSRSPRLIAKLKKARADIKAGRYATLEDVKRCLPKQ